jgi:hypothetical protein
MKSYRIPTITSFLLILLMVSAACASAPAAAINTSTPSPMPTDTALPTATTIPSPTPDVAATQKADAFTTLLNTFVEKKYLDSTAGNIRELNPTETDWNTGSWSPNNGSNSPNGISDFLFSAHYAWDAVKGSPQALGCAMVFGLQEDATGAQYDLEFSKSSISLSWLTQTAGSKFMYLYEIGKTSGTGRVDFKDKTETDFAALLRGLNLYVSFDGVVTQYALSAKRPTNGILVLNRNSYGGSCKMTNMMLWTPK